MIALYIMVICSLVFRIVAELLVPTISFISDWLWFFDVLLVSSVVFCVVGFVAKVIKDLKS